MTNIFWSEFAILLAGALVGAAAVLPYAVKLLNVSSQGKPLKLSLPALLALSFVQSTILLAAAIGLGLLAAHAIGLGAPYLEAALRGTRAVGIGAMIRIATVLGILAGALLLVADLSFLPHWPQALRDRARLTTLWDNFLASFYGGIDEELFMRLFGLSGLAWLLSRIWHTQAGLPTGGVLWIANVCMAVVFGLGHLPALKNIAGEISRIMLVRALVLNGVVGLLCGWLYWSYGLEAAIIAHFSVDIVYHVGGTIVLRARGL